MPAEIPFTEDKKNNAPGIHYSDDIATEICVQISSGVPLAKICEQAGMPAVGTVFRWLNDHATFADSYTRAREAQMDWYAEEISDIADNAGTTNDEIQKARLRIETRKWLMSKIKAKKYADRIEPTTVNNYTDNRKIDVAFETLKLASRETLDAAKRQITHALESNTDNDDK